MKELEKIKKELDLNNYKQLFKNKKDSEEDKKINETLAKLGFNTELNGAGYYREIVKDIQSEYQKSMISGNNMELMILLNELRKAKSPYYVELVKFYFEIPFSQFYQELKQFLSSRDENKLDKEFEKEFLGHNKELLDMVDLGLAIAEENTKQKAYTKN